MRFYCAFEFLGLCSDQVDVLVVFLEPGELQLEGLLRVPVAGILLVYIGNQLLEFEEQDDLIVEHPQHLLAIILLKLGKPEVLLDEAVCFLPCSLPVLVDWSIGETSVGCFSPNFL